jgi:hypothetical protein
MAGESSSGALREIIALFSLDVDDKGLKRGEHEVQGFLKGLRQVGEVVAEAFAVEYLKDFFKEQIEGAAHVQDLAERLNVSAASLKEFGIVASGAGVDFDTAAQSLGFLQKNLGEAETKGGEAGAAFARLGIDAKKAANIPLPQLLGDVAEGLSKLPNQNQQAAAAMAIFGRSGRQLLPMLRQGRAGIEGMTEEAKELAGGLGDDYYEAAKKAREEGEGFGFALESIRARVTLVALPAITWLLNSLKKGAISFIDFTKHTYFLKTAMIALGVGGALKLVSTLMKVGKQLDLLKPSFGETIKAIWGFAAPIIVVAALYLAFDELYTLVHGGKTVLGDVVDAWVGDSRAHIALALLLQDVWSATWESIRSFGIEAAAELSFVWKGLEATLKAVKGLLEGPKEGKHEKRGRAGVRADDEPLGQLNDDQAAAKSELEAAWKELKEGQKKARKLYDHSVFDERLKALSDGGYKYLDEKQKEMQSRGVDDVDPAKLPDSTKALLARLGNAKQPGLHFGAHDALARVLKVTAPHAAAGGVHTTINQTNHFASGGEDAAKKVGNATGQGLINAAQKENFNAYTGHRRP